MAKKGAMTFGAVVGLILSIIIILNLLFGFWWLSRRMSDETETVLAGCGGATPSSAEAARKRIRRLRKARRVRRVRRRR